MSNEENKASTRGLIQPAQVLDVVHRLQKAANEHNLPAFISCFAANYLSEPPNHPQRVFRGRAQVEKNWSGMFEQMSDFRFEINDLIVNGNQAWVEGTWTGTLPDQTRFHWRGVSIFIIEGSEIAASRLYMEPVEVSGLDINETLKQITNQES